MRTVLVWLLKAYRMVISPLYGQVCRYHPSCSAYALEAVQVHGAARGSWLAVRRLVRCHPWTPGGFDPVPPPDGGTAHGGTANGGSTVGPEARAHQEPGEDADGDLNGDLNGDAAWQPDAELPGPPAYEPSSPGATRAAPVQRSAAEESAPGLSPPSSSAPSTATSRGARA